MLTADELSWRARKAAAQRGLGGSAAGGRSSSRRGGPTADQEPLTLLQLTVEVIVLVLCRLDARSLAHLAATCSWLYHGKPPLITPVEEVLRQRAPRRAAACARRVCPRTSPRGQCISGPVSSTGATRRGRPWRLAGRTFSLWRTAS